MSPQPARPFSRREFLGGLTLAGTAGLLGLRLGSVGAEPPPETRTLKLVEVFGICIAPQRVAEELLRREGFNDVQYAEKEGISGIRTALASGEADISMQFAAPLIMALDAGDPILLLAGGHAGCFELFGSDRVRTIRDLKGKTVAVPELGIGEHIFIASMVAYVGLDPRKDITIVAHSPADSMRLLSEGKIDAYMAFPPDSQELRAKRIGHVLINSMIDRPWSQYFCCLVAANREFVRKRPVAVNRALRAILRAADICAREPERAARFLVDKGVAANYDFAVQLMKDIPYDKWREYDPEDTVRFYALRLQEAGMIKAIPQKIISQGTDWRFLNALKKELKE